MTDTDYNRETTIDGLTYEDIELYGEMHNYDQTYRDYMHAWEDKATQ